MSVTLVQASSSERHLESASSKEIPQTYRSGLVGASVGGRLIKPTHSPSGIAKHVVSVRQPSPRGHPVLRMQLAAASL